ncbi:hypothetical protein CONLIGDRAFT_697682 [Coniochaeta ligniaria NRRL 30616]|uniref:Uncharacterized protein n=1 Tax=Coniochaeta ligniaria NRRL 30616 TaxID=1408157 RepID=A0A1J7JUQ0_9PEZI|nr:hypothetical protein CONLIGDRAFT_697682 [Coniochaeta ligniaria NRRL 30616]
MAGKKSTTAAGKSRSAAKGIVKKTTESKKGGSGSAGEKAAPRRTRSAGKRVVRELSEERSDIASDGEGEDDDWAAEEEEAVESSDERGARDGSDAQPPKKKRGRPPLPRDKDGKIIRDERAREEPEDPTAHVEAIAGVTKKEKLALADQVRSLGELRDGAGRALVAQVALEPAVLKEARRVFDEKFGAVTDAEWETMKGLSQRGTGGWSDADERVLQRCWANDPFRVFLEGRSMNSWAKRLTLCRTVSALYRKTPEELLSLSHNLGYDFRGNAVVSIGGRQVPNPLWSSTFCERFQQAACHPWFQGKWMRLVTAIKYAVICRTHDVRPWEPEHHDMGDTFMHHFNNRLTQIDEDEPDAWQEVPLLRRAVAAAQADVFGMVGRSDWDVLFEKLEERAWKQLGPGQEPFGRAPADRHQPRWVTTADMDNVWLAVSATHGQFGHPGPWDPETWYYVLRSFIVPRHPNGTEGLVRVVVNAAMADRRTRAVDALYGVALLRLPGDPAQDQDEALLAALRDSRSAAARVGSRPRSRERQSILSPRRRFAGWASGSSVDLGAGEREDDEVVVGDDEVDVGAYGVVVGDDGVVVGDDGVVVGDEHAPEDDAVVGDEHAPEDDAVVRDEHAPEDDAVVRDEHAPEDDAVVRDEHAPEDDAVVRDEHAPEDDAVVGDEGQLDDDSVESGEQELDSSSSDADEQEAWVPIPLSEDPLELATLDQRDEQRDPQVLLYYKPRGNADSAERAVKRPLAPDASPDQSPKRLRTATQAVSPPAGPPAPETGAESVQDALGLSLPPRAPPRASFTSPAAPLGPSVVPTEPRAMRDVEQSRMLRTRGPRSKQKLAFDANAIPLGKRRGGAPGT